VKIEKIGSQTLILADCRDVLEGLPDFDAVVTDPPYGLGKKLAGGGCKARSDSWGYLVQKAYQWDAKPVCSDLLNAVLTKGKQSIVWGGNYFGLPASRCFLVWDKGPTMAGRSFAECEMAWTNMDKNARIFQYAPPVFSGNEPPKVHPTQKPIQVMKWCLGFLDNPKTVLDPFMGSATTLVACESLGIAGTGIEIDEEYFNKACIRLDEFTRQGVML